METSTNTSNYVSLHDLGLTEEASSPASLMIDGLLVTGGTGLRALSANWILLVSVGCTVTTFHIGR